MKIDCISDLHGFFPKLEGGDLLIIAGDLTARDEPHQLWEFCKWVMKQEYKQKIVISGNHDNTFFKNYLENMSPFVPFTYLCDSGTEFEGLKIWGSPWTKTFEGMNPHCKAFTCDTEEELSQKWDMIPHDTNILITHSPSFGNFDFIKERNGSYGASVGSINLWMKSLSILPKLHVFGHIHEGYGHYKHPNGITLVNASHVNQRYQPVNKPIRVIL